MSLSKDEVLHIAKLARIELTAEEVEKFRTQLSSIVEFIGALKEVDVTGVEPTTQVTGLKNVARADVVNDWGASAVVAAVNEFPDSEKGFLKVPPVFE